VKNVECVTQYLLNFSRISGDHEAMAGDFNCIWKWNSTIILADIHFIFMLPPSDSHSKLWIFRHRDFLRFTEDHPEQGPECGLIPCDSNSFLLNSTVYAKRHGLKRNSLNRNMQLHGFALDRSCDVTAELRARFPHLAPSGQHWVKRVFRYGPFNGRISDGQALVAHRRAAETRQSHVQSRAQAPPDDASDSAYLADDFLFSDDT
jgi:hypothetical protein